MPRLATAGVVFAALIHVAIGFSAVRQLPLRPAGSGVRGCLSARPQAGARWACSDEYKIVPSQLEGTGGGWTIQGVKPVSRAPPRVAPVCLSLALARAVQC